jgi:hypothetical protein
MSFILFEVVFDTIKMIVVFFQQNFYDFFVGGGSGVVAGRFNFFRSEFGFGKIVVKDASAFEAGFVL